MLALYFTPVFTPNNNDGWPYIYAGGPDSLAAARLLSNWHASTRKQTDDAGCLYALIVDHRLRSESSEEVKITAERARSMGFEPIIARVDWKDPAKKNVLQHRAREARYSQLYEACVQYGVGTLITGHHRDDQVRSCHIGTHAQRAYISFCLGAS